MTTEIKIVMLPFKAASLDYSSSFHWPQIQELKSVVHRQREAIPMVTDPVTQQQHQLTGIKICCLVTDTTCPKWFTAVPQLQVEPTTS